jgi:hypothetical protein
VKKCINLRQIRVTFRRQNERPVAVEENASNNNPVHESSDSDEDVAMPKRAANRKAARLVRPDDDDAVDMPATSRPQRPVSPVETQSSQDVVLGMAHLLQY